MAELRLVLIEDDDAIRSTLARSLRERGHVVDAFATGLEGLTRLVDSPPDAAVLDLGLPDVDGLDLLKMLRAVSAVPVIAATARDDDQAIVRTLDAGADDYIVKPFSTEQLEARLRAVLRRMARPNEPIAVGGLVVDDAARSVTLDGAPLQLSRREFDVLALLASRAGQVVTKRELLSSVWGQPHGGGDKTVDVHLSWLRRKLGETAAEPRYLHAVRGVGVKLVAPTT